MATVLDTLTTNLRFNADLKGLRKFEKGIKNAKARMDGIASAAFRVGAVISAPLLAIGKAAISTDAALKQLQARTKATDKQLAAFKRQAYEVGSQLPLNTADIIRAQTAFVQLGNSIEQAFAATPAIAMAAVAAEGVNVEAAARYASIALKAFKLEASDAGRVLDQMLMAETKTPAAARDIGEAFRYSAQAAADAGLSTSTYIAVLGTLAESGRSAEESSQGLNVLLQKLAKSTTGIGRGGKIVTKALQALGIEASEVNQAMGSGEKGIISFFQLLSDRSRHLPQETLTAALGTLVGESYASAFSSVVQNVDKLWERSDTIFDSMGESAEQSRIKMLGVSGAWESFKAQIDTVQNILADVGISGPLEGILRSIAESLAWLTKFNDEGELVHENLLRLITGFLKMGVALVGVGVAAKAMSIGLSAVTGSIALVRALSNGWIYLRVVALESLTKMKVAAVASFGAIKAAGLASLLSIRTAFTVMVATFKMGGVKALLTAGFAAIGTAGTAAWGVVSAAALSAWTVMTGGLNWVVIAVIAVFALIAAAVYKYWEPIKAFFFGFVEGVKEAFAPMSEAFDPLFNMLGQLVGWFGQLLGQTDLTEEGFAKAMSAGKTFGKIVGGILAGLLLPIERVAKGIGWIAEKLGLIRAPSKEEVADQRLQELLDAGKEASEQERLMREQEELTAKQPFLARATEANKQSLEEQRQAFEEAQAAAEKLVSSKQSAEAINQAIEKVKELRARINETLAEGVSIESGKLPAALEIEFQKASELLPQSDAKRGPLSNLMASGRALVDTLAKGIRQADPLKLALEPALAGLEPLRAVVEPVLERLEPLEAVVEPLRAVVEPVLERLEPLEAVVEPLRAVVEPVLERLEPFRAVTEPTLEGLEPLESVFGPLRAVVEPALEGLEPLKMALDTGGLNLPPLDSIAPPLPVAPIPTAAFAGAGAAGSETGGNKVEMSFGQGAIQINAPGGDAREIAGHIEQELREKMRAGVEQLDSRIIA